MKGPKLSHQHLLLCIQIEAMSRTMLQVLRVYGIVDHLELIDLIVPHFHVALEGGLH